MFLVFLVRPCQFQHQVKRESGEPLLYIWHIWVLGRYNSGFKTHLFLRLGGICLLANTNLRLIHNDKEFAPPCFLVPSAPVTSQSSSSSSSSSSRSPSHQSPSSRLITLITWCYMSHINITLIVTTAILFLINRPQLSKLNYSIASCVMPRGTVFQDEKPTSRKQKKVVLASCGGPFSTSAWSWDDYFGRNMLFMFCTQKLL